MSKMNEFTAIILQHEINFYYENSDITELPESEEEHIKECIMQGYNQGELCYYDNETDIESRGWWRIV